MIMALKKYSKYVVEGKKCSQIVDEMRFPLAVMVVLQHSMPNSRAVEGTISEYVRLLLHGFCDCAVPVFLLISGYLFFINIEKFTWSVYRNKIKSRIETIVIPYLVWNILYIVFHALQSIAFPLQMIESGKLPIQDFTVINYLSCFWNNNVMGAGNNDSPINIPLWYLWDLFILCLTTPVLWLVLRYLKYWFLIAITFVWIFTDWKGLCTGLNPGNLVFFATGAYLGMLKITEFRCYRYYWLAISAFIAILCFRVYSNAPSLFYYLLILSSSLSFLICFINTSTHKWLAGKKGYTMMIYVMQVFWLSIINQTYQRLFPESTDVVRIVSFFVLCVFTVIACIYTTRIGRRYIPNIMKFIGDR